MTAEYDVVVVGGGPAGYVCAIRAAQLGLKSACVESRGSLGGTCLNVGCIPSKALLESSHFFARAQHDAEEHGLVLSGISLNLAAMLKRKETVVSTMTKGIEGLFKKNKVAYHVGFGSFKDANTIVVKAADGTESELRGKHIVIATGSEPIELPFAKFDEDRIVSSTGALSFAEVPKKLIVIGGGVIGLELGSVWQRLGSEVTVIEGAVSILNGMDPDIKKEATRLFKKQGLNLMVDAKVEDISKDKKGVKVKVVGKKGSEELSADRVLVCVGRRPYTKGLGLEKIGVALDPKGRVPVDSHYRSQLPHIFAIGDVIEGPMLAHKSEEEGVAVAEIIAGRAGHVNYRAIPNVIYTWPEIASVGLGEDELKAQGIEVNIGKFPFAANGRAKAAGERDGFIKILADKKTDKLLGFHAIGPNASELIAEAVIAFEFDGSAEDLARSVHAHPTLAEAIKEAAMDVDKRAIHF